MDWLDASLRHIVLDFRYYLAWGRAAVRVGEVRRKRRAERLAQCLSDQEVFALLHPNKLSPHSNQGVEFNERA